jgi:hypothetical protein
MKQLSAYLVENVRNMFEGGQSGHMAHPFDYTEFTLRDLKGLIRNLFSGRIEDITEKVDGTNIQATVNKEGQVVFIRNNGDLNSAAGGMSITDMANKWADKPSVAKTFLSAGETITKVFNAMSDPVGFFNPKEGVKRVVNCECVVAGKTNIMSYASAQVDFHNIWTYEFDGTKWEKADVSKKGLDVIQKACETVDGAQITPKVIIKMVDDSNKILVDFIKELDKIFKDAGCNERSTVDEWKYARFLKYCKEGAEWTDWVLKSDEGTRLLYDRWFKGIKSTNIKKICALYPEDERNVRAVDAKEYQKWVADVMEPLDKFFLRLGNEVMSLCDGIINTGQEAQVCTQLKKDLEDVVNDVRKNGSVENNEKLTRQLNRLAELGDQVNPTEGIVFSYQGKLMKLTGSFAPLNQILGSIKFAR